ncbi:hypothetical protein [Runella sp.]|uniref:hypothetical protein n=1 Tax=Runella sp. TaxID=1960881 RepID=UPI003D1449DE
MNRFSVLYTLRKQYHHLSYSTRQEAEAVLEKISRSRRGTPIGIYDAKTELFFWERSRQKKHSLLTLGKQAKEEDSVISVVQNLRRQAEVPTEDELVELDIMLRPMPRLIRS